MNRQKQIFWSFHCHLSNESAFDLVSQFHQSRFCFRKSGLGNRIRFWTRFRFCCNQTRPQSEFIDKMNGIDLVTALVDSRYTQTILLSALLALCEGNPLVASECHHYEWPVMLSCEYLSLLALTTWISRWRNSGVARDLSRHGVHALLAHCGLVTPYGDIDVGQHWLVACRHQTIAWTNLISPQAFHGIHLGSVLQEVLTNLIRNTRSDIILLPRRYCGLAQRWPNVGTVVPTLAQR